MEAIALESFSGVVKGEKYIVDDYVFNGQDYYKVSNGNIYYGVYNKSVFKLIDGETVKGNDALNEIKLKPKVIKDEVAQIDGEFKWATTMDDKVIALFTTRTLADKFTINLQELYHRETIETRELA